MAVAIRDVREVAEKSAGHFFPAILIEKY